ncbi:MAG: cellulase family glycosylhydrolase [Anaerolineae bacterium]
MLIGVTLGLAAVAWFPVRADTYTVAGALPASVQAPQQGGATTVYLPALFRHYPWISPFGVEPRSTLGSQDLMDKAVSLGTHWVRLNRRISWRLLQPTEGAPIDWTQLADFEDELRAIKAQGFTPMVIVDDHPEWATVEAYGADGWRSWCAAIRPDKYEAFAQFVRALVARYKVDEFDVHYWELGNEPDVDPILVRAASPFGCWGDIDDPYYGGEAYGQMLKVVTPAIRAEDPGARVVLGGLLLDTPLTTDPNLGRPELFLEGILRAGAADAFDIVAFHAYPSYTGEKKDYDLYAGSWTDWGGRAPGKAVFLRQTMDRYGVDKPLFLNETALGCPPYLAACDPPDLQFFQVQASLVTRSFVRGIGDGIIGFVWYTLDGPGWRYTNLMEGDGTLKPVYIAYQQLTQQLDHARYLQPVDYGPGLEAYAFRRGTQYVHVVWAIEDETLAIMIPQNNYLAAYGRDGEPLSPTLVNMNYQLQVGFEPVYVILRD